MLILKAAALAIVVCVLVLCLKKDQPGFAFLLSLCGAAGLLFIYGLMLHGSGLIFGFIPGLNLVFI